MVTKSNVVLTAVCGLAGTITLTLYFIATFTVMPLPPPTATAADIVVFGSNFHTTILIDTWLQQVGTILSVIFPLSLVHLAGTSQTLFGKLTLLASAAVVSLSLAEGTFALGAVQAGHNGHAEAALTCFELTNVFIHIFLLAPSLFLMLGLALRKTNILPRVFIVMAILLGILFQALGIIALLNERFLVVVIAILMLQNLWNIAASITLLVRKKTWQ
jgi:hypothetical protein